MAEDLDQDLHNLLVLEHKMVVQVVDQIILVLKEMETLRQQPQHKVQMEVLLHQGQQLMEHPVVEELWW